MAYTGYKKPINKIVAAGKPPLSQEYKIEVATNMYAGRLVRMGTNQDDIIVGTFGAARGWLGYEQTRPDFRPETVDTIYNVNDMAHVLKGGGFSIVASLAAGFSVRKEDPVASWSNGQVMGPAIQTSDGVGLKIPFTKHATAFDTGIDIPAGVSIKDAYVEVTTPYSGATIDVGFINAVESGDEDGLLKGVLLTNAGIVRPITFDSAAAANLTLGALLQDTIVGDGASDWYANRKPYVTDGTIKSIEYKTSNNTVAGNIYIVMDYPGFNKVGIAGETIDASGADADLIVESEI